MFEVNTTGEAGTADGSMWGDPADVRRARPGATDMLRGSLAAASLAIQMALTEIDPEEMILDPGDGLRSLESLLGEATIALRDALVAIGHEELPEIPGGFEVRYARWGTGAGPDGARLDMLPIFTVHLEALDRAIRTLEPADMEATVDPPGCFDEDGLFSFETVGEVILAVSGFIHFLAGEASMIRLALGEPPAPDPFDDLIASWTKTDGGTRCPVSQSSTNASGPCTKGPGDSSCRTPGTARPPS
jgi:hypothetical protein